MIAIIGALDEELKTFLGGLEAASTEQHGPFTFYRGRLAGKDILLTRSGVGKVMAAMTAQKIIDAYAPSHIILTGIAGALRPDLNIGDLVVSADCIQHDMDAIATGFERGEVPYTGIRVIQADKQLIELARSYRPARGKVVVGRILSGDQFITASGQESHSYLRGDLAGDAIEMEGAAVAFVCHLHHLPFVVLRTISDRADHAAAVDYEQFLPIASQQSHAVVSHMLSALP